MARLSRSQTGISLISVLVALALLATTAVAVSRLIVTSSAGSRITRENFVAIQIAREGLELIRAQRDTNWFDVSKPLWTRGLCDAVDPSNNAYLIFDSAMAIDGQPQTINPTDTNAAKLYRTRSGQFVHDPSGHTETNYSRLIKIDCTNAAATLPDPASIEVTSTVSWDARGASHNIELKEKLFNWYTTP